VDVGIGYSATAVSNRLGDRLPRNLISSRVGKRVAITIVSLSSMAHVLATSAYIVLAQCVVLVL